MLISGHSGINHPHNTISTLRGSESSAAIKPAEQSDSVHGNDKDGDKDEIEVNKASRSHSTETIARPENELDQSELKQLRELRTRDREVRAHEQAHAAVAGALAKGGPSFSFQRGPDGQLYAIGGEVQIDTAALAGDARATVQKAQQIRRAALAPAQPSSQDRAVAAQAAAMETTARAELAKETAEEAKTEGAKETEGGGVSEKDGGEFTQELRETGGNCAVCGGHHSAESHVATVEGRVLSTFNTEETNKHSGELLNISV